jgi:hypothetical protein
VSLNAEIEPLDTPIIEDSVPLLLNEETIAKKEEARRPSSGIKKLAEILKAAIEEKRHSYRVIQRKYGEGKIRLGSSLEITNDIYSLAFIS